MRILICFSVFHILFLVKEKQTTTQLMKKYYLLTAAILLLVLPSTAQQWREQVFGTDDNSKINFYEVQKRADVYFKEVKEEIQKERSSSEKDFEGNTDPMHRAYFEYQRWAIENAFLVKADGSLATPLEAHTEYQNYLNNSSTNTRAMGTTANWKNINRTTCPGGYTGMGASRCITFHPTDVKTFWVGADGGIWKTTNGGSTYTPIGDNLPWLYVGSICVDPTNTNTIYACTGYYLSQGYDRSVGVYKTTDNGVTWKPTGLKSNLVDYMSYSTVVMSPVNPQILLVGCLTGASQGLYRTTDGGTTWTKVLSGQKVQNISYKPGDGNIIYAATSTNSGSIYRSTDAGLTWNVVQSFTGGGYTDAITCSLVNTAYVAMIHVDGNNLHTLWVSTNSGLNWVKKASVCSDYTCRNVAFSALNANTLYMGYFEVLKSTDLGATFGSHLTSYCCGSNGVVEIHGDFNDIKVNPLDKKLYYASDGGLSVFDESVSPYGTASWKEISNGLITTHYMGVGNSQKDAAMYGGGGMDNGAYVHKTNGTWTPTVGGDIANIVFDPFDINTFYTVWDRYIERTTNGSWSNITRVSNNIPNAPSGSWLWGEIIATDPNNANVIITGEFPDVWRSTNKGDSWTKIGSNLSGGNCLRGVAIAPSNSNVIYTHNGTNLYVTKNGGTNWSTYNVGSGGGGDITAVAIHSTQPGTIWVSENNWTAGKKVFSSTDYGATWTNVSGSLPNLSATFMLYDKSTDGVYVSMFYGVFYKNSTMSDWVNFSQGLPNTELRGFTIQNNAKKLRCASGGRGMWETDLYSGSATGIDNSINQQALINAYPNPNNGTFTLEIGFSDNGNYKLDVINVLGQIIYTESLNINNRNYNFSKQFNLGDLPKGVYMVKINGNGTNTNKKIIIE